MHKSYQTLKCVSFHRYTATAHNCKHKTRAQNVHSIRGSRSKTGWLHVKEWLTWTQHHSNLKCSRQQWTCRTQMLWVSCALNQCKLCHKTENGLKPENVHTSNDPGPCRTIVLTLPLNKNLGSYQSGYWTSYGQRLELLFPPGDWEY